MKKNNIIKKISAIVFFTLTILSFVVLLFLLLEWRKSPEITKESLADSLSTKIYDKNNNLIATIGNERREFVDSNDIPQDIKDAVLSVEDSRFDSHIGIDPKRIIKAFMVNLSAGSSLEGGSTITQQVVKSSLLTSQKTYERKIQEAILSLKLESKYTKEDILEMYLNKIYYSDHQYGIKSAAKYFYNKELNELELNEIALLAGLPQQPVVYNPYTNSEAAKNRRDTVLYAMYNNEKITKEEYEDYISVPIEEGLIKRDSGDRKLETISNYRYGAYIDLVVKEIKKMAEFSDEQDPFALGLNIYTNLNPDLQDYVQNMLDNNVAPMKQHPSQAAITVLDTTTGLVEAISGGKNYIYGGFNYAIDSKLQPGSSIKPILDYAPGIEYYGWDSLTTFLDTPYLISGTNHYILNWDRLYHGNVTMRRAIAMSYNVPAVRAFERVGFERSKYFANKIGIDLTTDAPTAAIGGHVDTVSPLSMAAAYATFGNKGYYNSPSGIIKIQDKNGNDININKNQTKKAMNDSTAFLITDILKDVVTYNGTSPNAKVDGFELAAKSGSTTFDSSLALSLGIDAVNATKDSWLVGYTTKYTVSVWQGADSVDTANKALMPTQTQVTQLVFADIMKKAHNGKIPDKFEIPNTVDKIGETYYAKDRSIETDNMYVGTSLDSVYQARASEKERENRKIANTITNSTRPTTNNNNTPNTIMRNNTTNRNNRNNG